MSVRVRARVCVPAPGVRVNGDGSKVPSRWLH